MSHRPESVGKQVREILSDLIQHRLKDPGLGFITVTGVDMTRDLRVARVFISVMGSESDRQQSLEAVNRAAPFLRRELGSRIRLRNTPELQFGYDESLERGDRINRLLDRLDT
jgi:ribosome-binding factor A